MVKFIKMKTKTGFKTQTTVTSKTIPHGLYGKINRKQRRAAIFAQPVKRLLNRIEHLRGQMIEAGIDTMPKPKFNNKKYLSGYMSKLVRQALA